MVSADQISLCELYPSIYLAYKSFLMPEGKQKCELFVNGLKLTLSVGLRRILV